MLICWKLLDSLALLSFTNRPMPPHAKIQPYPRCRRRTKLSAASSRTLTPFLPIAHHHNPPLEHREAPNPPLPSHLQTAAAATELTGEPRVSSSPVPSPN
uniref:Uncharacterized protein n=1 Tax=Arundo donax TaxID=35708 RepID=A0A0A9AC23_ARUDO